MALYKIEQFTDQSLAHYSYALLSEKQIVLVDPARNPKPYYDFAERHEATIAGIIETHPHADFVSSHWEIAHTTGATIYASKLLDAEYPHKPFNEGDVIKLGNVRLKAMDTPGHSPDSISIVVVDDTDQEVAVFTGDTLFLGDCGRPDLRENVGALTATAIQLANQMYHSLRSKLLALPDHVIVYPAHGAGSLCGKGISNQSQGTMGEERKANWSLQPMSQEDFVSTLLLNQPFIPKYFSFDVALNKHGAAPFLESVEAVQRVAPGTLNKDVTIVDIRPQGAFKKGHLKGAINLMNEGKFETWLGSVIAPEEPFYLIGENDQTISDALNKIAKIGYEQQVVAAFPMGAFETVATTVFDDKELRNHEDAYTIVDVRNESETLVENFFKETLHIPLHKLRERIDEIPTSKPIVVHCAGGYRSAAAASIIAGALNNKVNVYDLSESIKSFKPIA